MTVSATRADVRLLLVLLAVTGHPLPRRCKNPACGKTLRKRPGRSGYEGARDLCGTCYPRARRAGFPAVVPPPGHRAPTARLTAARTAQAAERRQRYGVLRARGHGPHAAAARLGLTADGTVRLYEAAWQASRQEQQRGEGEAA